MASRNVLCLSVDRLQAGMLGPYGNTWLRTPELDRLAASSFVFDQAFACNPQPEAVLNAWWPSAAFANHGISLVTDDPFAHAASASSIFADKHLVQLPAQVRKPAKDLESTQLAALFSAAIDRLSGNEDAQSLWIHTRGMAGPWDAPSEMRNQFADEEDPAPPRLTTPPNLHLARDYDPDELLGITHAYAGQIKLFDTLLGVLLSAFEESAAAENTLLLLVGMRGYPLGEHLRVGECDSALYIELTHVPFLVRYPDGTGALARSPQLMNHEDVPQLIAEWLGTQTTSATKSSFQTLLEGGEVPWRNHLRLQSLQDRAIRTPAWYLRETEVAGEVKRELYVKPDDRWEINDIADRCPYITTQLGEILSAPANEDRELPESLLTAHG